MKKYTHAELKNLEKQAMGLRDQLCLAEQEAAQAGDDARRARLRAIEWHASARWERRRSKAMYPPAWEYGLEGDSALIWDDLVRGQPVEVMGAVPFTITPEWGIFFGVTPKGKKRRARTVMMHKHELSDWVRCLTLPKAA